MSAETDLLKLGINPDTLAAIVGAAPALVAVDGDGLYDGTKLVGMDKVLTADSANFGGSGANTEAAFSNGTFTVDANRAKAGTVIEFEAYVAIPTTVSTDTLRLRVRFGATALGGTAIFDSTAIDVANDDYAFIRGQIDMRTIGASGTALAVVNSRIKMGATDAAQAPTVTALSSLATTSDLILAVTAAWSTQSANVAVLKHFNARVVSN